MSNKRTNNINYFFSFITLTTNSSFSNIFLPIFLPFIPLFFPLINSLVANKGSNRYYNKNLFIKLLTILSKSIISTHKKTFVKTANLAYFSRLKKYSQV